MYFSGTEIGAGDKDDLGTVQDLLDTLQANTDHCVGMAANMIGVRKNVIAVQMGMVNAAMLNPVIVKKQAPMRRKRAVCRWRESAGLPGTRRSKWSIRTFIFVSTARNIPDGSHRLFSMSATI